MKYPKNIVCVRHGESTLNAWHSKLRADKIFKQFIQEYAKNPISSKTFFLALQLKNIYGSFVADHKSALTFHGRKQARGTAYTLKKSTKLPDIIYVSPYTRTVETLEQMQRIWPELKQVPVEFDWKLREQEVGSVSLCGDFDVFFALNPKQREMFELQDLFYYRFPNGESAVDVMLRLEIWFQNICREYPGKKIMVISHFIAILSIKAYLEKWGSEKFLKENNAVKKINCAVSEFKNKAGKLQIVRFNEKLW